MRIRFSLGKSLMNRDACTYLLCLCLTISSTSVGGIRQLILQIPRIDATLRLRGGRRGRASDISDRVPQGGDKGVSSGRMSGEGQDTDGDAG